MSLETDLLLDRRRLKRRLFFWRSFAVLAVLAAVLVVLRGEHVGFGRSHLARLTVSGIISDDRKLDEAVTKLADNANVKALIVAIDSPGGSVAGGEQDARLWLAKQKSISADLPVEDVSTSGLASRAFSSSLGWMFDALWKSLFPQGVMLDGTRLLWQRFGG
jgi:ClpP class serine protease